MPKNEEKHNHPFSVHDAMPPSLLHSDSHSDSHSLDSESDSDSGSSYYETDSDDDVFFPSCRIPDLDMINSKRSRTADPKSRKPTQFWVAKMAAKDFFRPSMKAEVSRSLYFMYAPDWFDPFDKASASRLNPWLFGLEKEFQAFDEGITLDRNYRVYTTKNHKELSTNVIAVKVEFRNVASLGYRFDLLFNVDPAWGKESRNTNPIRAHFVTGDNCCIKCKRKGHIVAQCPIAAFIRCTTMQQSVTWGTYSQSVMKKNKYTMVVV
ncbi:hypothetical protein CJU90_3638 [Yarrowia sp. C11]|nr:hypothetical protein CKK34_5250 [Yarrowia sp. E02]KAG5367354.1 hypothetical protein CJU90_3638 [Yarrowia sp. C11]